MNLEKLIINANLHREYRNKKVKISNINFKQSDIRTEFMIYNEVNTGVKFKKNCKDSLFR